MKIFKFCALVLLCALTIPALASKKPHAWLTGTTLDTEHNRYFAGSVYSGNESGTMEGTANSDGYGNTTANGSYSGSTTGYSAAVYRVYETYVIDTGTMVYMAQERLHWRWSHSARLTVNGPVQYYLDGRHIHILDEDGKEHEAEIIKQVLKTPAK